MRLKMAQEVSMTPRMASILRVDQDEEAQAYNAHHATPFSSTLPANYPQSSHDPFPHMVILIVLKGFIQRPPMAFLAFGFLPYYAKNPLSCFT
ncbi:hypothetical protein VNO77_33868 [Canavalia gladiata]|uniref:Uncharacterized protein n=1 Tax=Canavalia gladiata TaxID=3824 RepID=A0AAN9KFI3_CANGL